MQVVFMPFSIPVTSEIIGSSLTHFGKATSPFQCDIWLTMTLKEASGKSWIAVKYHTIFGNESLTYFHYGTIDRPDELKK